jgi:hypothetical protein
MINSGLVLKRVTASPAAMDLQTIVKSYHVEEAKLIEELVDLRLLISFSPA